MDRFSPLAPAFIRVLVLPIGHIEKSRYLALVGRLKDELSAIKLKDVFSYYNDDDYTILSPKDSHQGTLFFNYTTSAPSELEQQLPPFELFREPLLVLGFKAHIARNDDSNDEDLDPAAKFLREQYPRVIHRQILVLTSSAEGASGDIDNALCVTNAEQSNEASLKQAICHSAARFLAELSTYARAIQASPTVATPGQTSRSLQRTREVRDRDVVSQSGHSTPPQSNALSNPADPRSIRSPPPNHDAPSTSSDPFARDDAHTDYSKRPDSRSNGRSPLGARASSQDRVSVQGFGTSTSHEKAKGRGKARVGIVFGSLYLIAGQWSQALRTLTEHTSKARVFSDHLWHAKGLENILICMLLLAQAGTDFQVPPVCFLTNDRPSSARLQSQSVNPATDSSTDASQEATVRKLCQTIPDLLAHILYLYRCGEGSLELPFACIAEGALRFAKLLALLYVSDHNLNRALRQALPPLVQTDTLQTGRDRSFLEYMSFTKMTIEEVLSYSEPGVEDSLVVSDHIRILAGTASIYTVLGMKRKKAKAVTSLASKLANALTQARKRGAAEIGIHPAAANLSTDNAIDAVLGNSETSQGMREIIIGAAECYGLSLADVAKSELYHETRPVLGNDRLKLDVGRSIAAFCEASGDPEGVLLSSVAMLESSRPSATIDLETDTKPSDLSQTEQLRLSSAISRTNGVIDQSEVIHASYWDPFLVRGLGFLPPSADSTVVHRTVFGASTVDTERALAANPLLYDPNASRPNTAEAQQAYVLVQDESRECQVILQNPYDVPVHIESLGLVSEGLEFKAVSQSVVLEPMRLQEMRVAVSPRSKGDFSISGCRIHIRGLAEQVHPIVTAPWETIRPTLVKTQGQDAMLPEVHPKDSLSQAGPRSTSVKVTVIEPQPVLVLEGRSMTETTMMLLDGETQEVTLTLKNASDVSASIFDIITSGDAMQYCEENHDRENDTDPFMGRKELGPGQSRTHRFLVVGRAAVSRVEAQFYYGCGQGNTQHARILSVPIDLTVNAALQVGNVDTISSASPVSEDDDSFLLCFNLGNAWPRPLSYSCSASNPGNTLSATDEPHHSRGVLAPGEVQRAFLPVRREIKYEAAGHGIEDVKQSFLKRLELSWTVGDREGTVDVSGISLSHEALDIIRGTPVSISLEVLGSLNSAPEGVEEAYVPLKAGSFVTVRAKLNNRSTITSEPLLLRIDPSGLDAADKIRDESWIAMAGARQRLIAPILQGDHRLVDLAICPIFTGPCELRVSAMPANLYGSTGKRWTAQRSVALRVV